MNAIRNSCLAASASVLACLSAPVSAETIDTLDLTASAGYSTNPLLRTVNDGGSATVRGSARAAHTDLSELGSTTLTAFVEGTSYLNNYGVRSIFALSANTNRKVSETVNVFGSANFSGDLAGQLSNRFLYVPPVVQVPDPAIEPPPTPVTVEDPDLFSFDGRQYRINGSAGASIRAGERSSFSFAGGAQHIFFKNDLLNDYTTVFGTGSYNMTLSERTTVGFRVGAHHTEYENSSDNTTVITPAATIRTRLSQNIDASASLGLSFANIDRGGDSRHTTNISASGRLCHTSETERLCGHVGRYSQTSAVSSLVNTTSVGVDWFKKLDAMQTLQVSASAARYSRDETSSIDSNITHHFRTAVSYSRQLNLRLSTGADVGVRALSRRHAPDPDTDFSGSLFLRYRLGDLG